MLKTTSLTIKISFVEDAITTLPLEMDDRRRLKGLIEDAKTAGKESFKIAIEESPIQLLEYIMRQKLYLTDNQKRAIVIRVNGSSNIDELMDFPVKDASELSRFLMGLVDGAKTSPCLEMKFGNRWYPIAMSSNFYEHGGVGVCNISCSVRFADRVHTTNIQITDYEIKVPGADTGNEKLSVLLDRFGLKRLETDLTELTDMNKQAHSYNMKPGIVVDVSNSLITLAPTWWGGKKLVEMPFGSIMEPRRTVIEPELEAVRESESYRDNFQCVDIPLVRVFSLEMKAYGYVDVRDVIPTQFDNNAINRLILPDDIDSIVKKVFAIDSNKLFGDVVRGKHGGLIIMASGPAGTGKTLTAEVFAEHTNRPLYVMEVAELGTELIKVEENLRRIFARAARWNAVLLFDEADIFLSKRDNDLNRSAIVGIFLRLMDYYPGLFFLTSNRRDVIDPAFKSRITLFLDYNELTPEQKLRIWKNMIAGAGMKFTGTDDEIKEIAKLPLNGRQIRNQIRLLKILHVSEVSHKQILGTVKYAGLDAEFGTNVGGTSKDEKQQPFSLRAPPAGGG